MSGKRSFDAGAILERLRAGGSEGQRLDMRIDANGIWYHEGGRIGRLALCRLFASVLHKDEDGRHWLVTPVEQGRVAVEDVAFVAVEVEAIGGGETQRLRFRTNLDEWCEAGPDHPLVVREGPLGVAPYVNVRGRLEARLLRSVYYHLVDLAHETEDGKLAVWSGGRRFELGDTA